MAELLVAHRHRLLAALLTCTLIKFLMVIGYFMHLKFDNGRFSRTFALGAIGAFTLYVAVLLMFGVVGEVSRARLASSPRRRLVLGSVAAAYLIWAPPARAGNRRGDAGARRRLFLIGMAVLS